ncbi:MAG: AP2 domain-containing protein [Terriglobales bacterium]
MREIPLTRGYVALVDDCDYERVSQFKWHALMSPGKHTVYAVRNIRMADGRRTAQLMHRFILGLTDPKILTDHQDRNGLHNWQDNLRIATRSPNCANAGKRRNAKTSRFRGVSWDKPRGNWQTEIQEGRARLYLGRFTDEVDAAKAYDRAALEHFGEFANLNFQPKKLAVSNAGTDVERAC